MKRRPTLTGLRSGRLVVIGEGPVYVDGRELWLCRCDCGASATVRADSLRYNRTKSCGCLKIEAASKTGKNRKKTGMSRTKIHLCWANMIDRCHNPKNAMYKAYGGRGIAVCDEWRVSFDAFRRDMEPTHHADLALDRIDNNKGYFKSNCRWVTSKQNNRNKRSNRWVTVSGTSMVMAEFAEMINRSSCWVFRRLRDGLSPDEIVAMCGILSVGSETGEKNAQAI